MMAAILAVILLSIVHSGHGMEFGQVTCDSFQLENGKMTPDQPHGYDDGETVKVTCDSGYELIGKNQFTCYEDIGGWDGNKPQCMRMIVQCEYPDMGDGGTSMSRSSQSGNVQETEDLARGATIHPNNVIHFTCDVTAHIMVIEDVIQARGHTHAVTCLSNGMWEGALPKCRKIICDSFELVNGNINPPQTIGYFDGDDVRVTCDPGYKLNGKSQLTCSGVTDGWDAELPTCEQVRCETPDFTNGRMSNNGRRSLANKTSIIPSNTTVHFECQPAWRMRVGGFLQGSGYVHKVLCQPDGEWAGDIPTCEDVSCESFELANGKVTPAQPNGYFAGDDVTMTCDVGYELDASSQRICLTGGWSDEAPTCEQVRCETPDFTNGRMSTNGRRSLANKTSIIPSNTTVHFECQPAWRMRVGGFLQGSGYVHKVLCQPDGEWAGDIPTCEDVSCESFELANGKVPPAQPNGYFAGEDVTMTCDVGYELDASSQRICLTGGWSDEAPTCEQVKCQTPVFTNGFMYKIPDGSQHMLITKTSIISINTVVYFECPQAWRLRVGGLLQADQYVHNVLCRPNGEWAGEMPTCEKVTCGTLVVPNGRVTPAADGGYYNGAKVDVACDAGYKLAGKAQITCTANGWGKQLGECIGVDAPSCKRPRFDNGHMTRTYQEGENTIMGVVKPDDVIRAGDLVEFRCNKGYMLSMRQVEVFEARCHGNGTWDSSLPTCQLFECSSPPTKSLLKYTLDGQKAYYRCLNDNYELLGPTTLTCRMDLKAWFPHLPTCRRKACPTIRWPENGMHLHQGSLVNDTVTAECYDAFTLNGTAHRTCLQNGSWSGEPAVCSSANHDCPNPGIPDGGLRSGNELHFGASVTFSCETNFILLGEEKQHCQQPGKWSAPAVKCLGPDEYSDPHSAVNRWGDIINSIERDNSERHLDRQVFFLMDSSGSIRNSEINAQRNFIGNIALKLRHTKMSWVAFNTTSFLLAERQNTSGITTAMRQQRVSTAGASNVKRAFRKVRDVLVRTKPLNQTKASIILLLNDHINEGGSLSNAMRMKWAWKVKPDLYLVTLGGYLNRRDLLGAVSMFKPLSHHNAFFLKHKDDLNDLTNGIKKIRTP